MKKEASCFQNVFVEKKKPTWIKDICSSTSEGMSKAFPQKHVKESTEIIIKDRVAEKSGPRVTENMASLRLNINLKDNM